MESLTGLLTLMLPAFILLLVVSAMFRFLSGRGSVGSTVAPLVLLGGAVAFLSVGPARVIDWLAGMFGSILGVVEEADGGKDSGADSTSETPSPTPAEPAPPATPSTASEQASSGGPDVPWGLVGAIVGGILLTGLLIVVLVVFVIPAYRRRRDALKVQRAEHADRAAARQRLYDSLIERHDRVNAAYAEFLFDIFAILERPALNDVAASTTAAFLNAHARAADLRPATCPAGDTLGDYEGAVRDLDLAWTAADTHARRVGTGMLSGPERKKINQAISMLTTARDASATPAERRTYYDRAMQMLDGIIVLPEQTVAALEIEAGKVLAIEASPVLV